MLDLKRYLNFYYFLSGISTKLLDLLKSSNNFSSAFSRTDERFIGLKALEFDLSFLPTYGISTTRIFLHALSMYVTQSDDCLEYLPTPLVSGIAMSCWSGIESMAGYIFQSI